MDNGEGTRGEKEKLAEQRKLAEMIRARAAYMGDMAGAAGQIPLDMGRGVVQGGVEGIRNLQGLANQSEGFREFQRGGQQAEIIRRKQLENTRKLFTGEKEEY